MGVFEGAEGDFVRLIALPMANIACAIAEIREHKETMNPDELDKALECIQASANRVSDAAVSADNHCRFCAEGRSKRTWRKPWMYWKAIASLHESRTELRKDNRANRSGKKFATTVVPANDNRRFARLIYFVAFLPVLFALFLLAVFSRSIWHLIVAVFS